MVIGEGSQYSVKIDDFDFVIDVRTPCEYAYSHIPSAINLPVLSNEEHARIGKIHKKDSPLKARILGASIICKNISILLDSLSKDSALQAILHHKNKLMIYCARGGKRSESMLAILSQIGFRASKLEGGYKTYRNEVLDFLSACPQQDFIVFCGPTGCGKSEIIQALSQYSIDLESLALHYGSSFGGIAALKGTQPSQKMFENMLFEEFCKKNHEKVLFIEAESRKLGNVVIPATLFKAYHRFDSIRIFIDADMDSRLERIVKIYQNISENEFLSAMQKIKPYISSVIFCEIMELWKKINLKKIAEILIEKYYDKVYKKTEYSYKIFNANTKETIKRVLEIKNAYSYGS